ncbi:hypothetical protein [Winogradskyella jejuensis]|uniref:Uncharacterized protein n=1 Tax=Winogradskyella jejuensis TaxID=1089305 RepID=A0A1M5V398_9FLAO|nr:hypothetical protein [Winogradskyella jejuensis]SHH69747.1 hypothetical protein SAMN05444148_2706 [Winogradskyella jejuensis]
MKRILPLLLLTSLLQNCNEDEFKNGGQFKAVNNDLFYALRISSEMDSIQFFLMDEWPIDISEETFAEKQNLENSISGTISVKENEILITELESDFLSSERPKLKNMIIKNGKIYADCENITKYVWGKTNLGNCKSEQIEFIRIKK